MHIVPYTLCYRFALKLREYGSDIHHSPTHRRCRIKLLADRNKGNIKTGKLLNQTGKVADVAAYSVKTVDNYGFEFPLVGCFHHSFEIRTVQIAAGKALVLKNNGRLRVFIAEIVSYILFAKLYLIADALALACVF